MAYEIVEVGPTEVANVLGLEEGHFADVKAVEISPASLTKSLSAYSNADGGELYVGIDEDKATGALTWRGFSKAEDANGHIQAFESTFPLDQFFEYSFLRDPTNPGAGAGATRRHPEDARYPSCVERGRVRAPWGSEPPGEGSRGAQAAGVREGAPEL